MQFELTKRPMTAAEAQQYGYKRNELGWVMGYSFLGNYLRRVWSPTPPLYSDASTVCYVAPLASETNS